MVTKKEALELAFGRAMRTKGKIPLQAIELEEWIKSNYSEAQQIRMYEYCKWLSIIDSPWTKTNIGYELGIYEDVNRFDGYDENHQEIFKNQVMLKSFGQVFLKHLFRLCSERNVHYYNNI